MAVTVRYKLSPSHTKRLSLGGVTFIPGTTYTESSFKMNSAIANAIANGTLVFADSSSLSEHKTNPIVAQAAADDSASTNGSRPQGATATTAKLKLAPTQTSPLSIGSRTFLPKVIYQDSAIKLNDPYLLSAIARGLVVFADASSAASVIANPVVYARITEAHALTGWLGAHNVYGV